jgi:hypothetical protein
LLVITIFFIAPEHLLLQAGLPLFATGLTDSSTLFLTTNPSKSGFASKALTLGSTLLLTC